MIAAAGMVVELVLSCAALLGMGVLHRILTRRDPWDPLNRRFLFGLRVTMLLFAGRVLLVLTGAEAFRILILLGAGLIPLAVLLLTEGLLRRHAPRWGKALIGTGTLAAVVTAFWYSGSIDPARLLALLAFQIVGFCLSGWLIISRDRASLSAGENAMVARLGLSLIALIPLAAGDFLMDYLGLPIQFSALAVLVLCWLAIGLSRAHWDQRAILISLALMIGAAAGTGGLIGFLGALGRDGTLLAIALVLAALFVVAIFHDARALRAEAQSLGLLRRMADARATDPLEFLRDLQDHPLVESAAVLQGDSLSGLQGDTLAAVFKACPVLRRTAPPALGAAADEHIAYLFDRYGATHIMQVQDVPLVLVALTMPSLATSPVAELELEVVQRMASLMAERGKS